MVTMNDSFQMPFDDKTISEMHPFKTTSGKNCLLTMSLWIFLSILRTWKDAEDEIYTCIYIQSNFGSQTSWFSNNLVRDQVALQKMSLSQLFNKTSSLDSVPGNPFMSIPVWSVKTLLGKKQKRFSFQTNHFSNSFLEQNKCKNRGSTIYTHAHSHIYISISRYLYLEISRFLYI